MVHSRFKMDQPWGQHGTNLEPKSAGERSPRTGAILRQFSCQARGRQFVLHAWSLSWNTWLHFGHPNVFRLTHHNGGTRSRSTWRLLPEAITLMLRALTATGQLRMRARLWLLTLSALPVAGQDPATIATAMAGRVAGMMAEKAEQKIESRRVKPSPTRLAMFSKPVFFS